jgi:hypothetical protein
VCFLKHIISRVRVDTIATVNVTQKYISQLHVKIVELGGDITKFHSHVKSLITIMASYNQVFPERLPNLFEAYKMIEDEDFHHYVMIRKSLWEDGTYQPTPQSIMTLMEKPFKMKVERGTWKIPSKKDEAIVALQTQIEALQTTDKRTSDKNAGHSKEQREA